MKLLLFPHQLFHPHEFKDLNVNEIHLIEHTLFYGKRKYKYIAETHATSPKASPMIFNKKKLIFHRASMLDYIQECKSHHFKVIFHENVNTLSSIKSSIFNSQKGRSLVSLSSLDIYYYDPVDHELQDELNHIFPRACRMETPSFLFTTIQLLEYFKNLQDKAPETVSHAPFYQYSLKTHDIPFITKSHDTENRESIPVDQVPTLKIKIYDTKYIKEAIQWVNKNYSKNYGTEEDIWLPSSRKDAKQLFTSFLKDHLSDFGKYQDAMAIQQPFLHHSCISALLNVGLLTPKQVVDDTIAYYKKHKREIPLASFEGFIRQMAGWREYERMIYLTLYSEIVKSNIFKHKRLLSSVWYEERSERKEPYLTPLEDAIHMGWKYGYLHHIYRLMVVANAMNLLEIQPYEAYRWFMEFAVDSYDWVMIGNVYSMGLWADGGKTMRKPYLSSNAYIDKMSVGYDDEWGHWWRSLFYIFLYKHQSIIKKTIYVRNLATYQVMSVKNKFLMNKEASHVQKRYTK